jgi:hypothetical protein
VKRWIFTFVVLCGILDCRAAAPQSPFPRLLPPANDLRLTLRENPQSGLPLGRSCAGEAESTLTCRAFLITLENLSARAIHLSGVTCREPAITIEKKDSHASGGWWPVSLPNDPRCPDLVWTNRRLKPGERLEYETRLIGSQRRAESFAPGLYTLRAEWVLFGCTEALDGTDCLAPLQNTKHGLPADVEFQEAVIVYSNEVIADARPMPSLGDLKFSFDVTARPGQVSNDTSKVRVANCAVASTGVDCMVFHYKILNLGDRPIRNRTRSCSDSGIYPEYLAASGWVGVPQIAWVCLSNISVDAEILDGGAIEGEFMLSTLPPGYDTTPLRTPGEHRLRFTFMSNACFASPDASFCLIRPERQVSALSQEITVGATTPADNTP